MDAAVAERTEELRNELDELQAALAEAVETVRALEGKDMSGTDCRDAGEGYDLAIRDAVAAIRAKLEAKP